MNWKITKLEDLCSKITDGSHNPPKAVSSSKFMMLSSKNIENGKITFDKPRYISEEGFVKEDKRTDVQPGDVLLTVVGTIGRTAVVPEDIEKFTLQRSVAVIKPLKEKVLPKFLMYFLQNNLYALQAKAHGVAQKGIYLNKLKTLDVSHPSVDEQKQIVDKIEELFSINANIQSTFNELPNKLDMYKQSILQEAFESINTKYRKTIGEAIKYEREREDPKSFPHLPYIGMDDIETQTTKLLGTKNSSDMKSSSEHFYPGDVLYGRLRPYLNKVYCADFEGLCSAEFLIFRKQDLIDSKYLMYFLNRWKFVSEVNKLNTGDRPRVKFEQIASFPISVPPLVKQKNVVEEIEEKFSVVNANYLTISTVNKNINTFKQSILNKAFSGELIA